MQYFFTFIYTLDILMYRSAITNFPLWVQKYRSFVTILNSLMQYMYLYLTLHFLMYRLYTHSFLGTKVPKSFVTGPYLLHLKKQGSMIRKCHNHTPQANTQHSKEEPLNTNCHKTSGRNLSKATYQDDCKTRWTQSTE